MAEGRIEPVRGALSDDRAEGIVDFWAEHGAFTEEEGRRHLDKVVCFLDAAGEIAGVNAAFPAEVELIGGRPFWIYRSFLLPEAAEADSAMINAAFAALGGEFESTREGPIGLCLVLGDPEEMANRREAIWEDTELMYAGYLEDGRQARIRYFEDATIGPGHAHSPSLSETRGAEYPLDERYRILPMSEAGVTQEDVIRFWEDERAISSEEARRRVHEVHLVAVDRERGVAGVSSAYLQRNPQLGMDCLHYRARVGEEHRRSSLAVSLAVRGREVLEQRFTSGEDARAGAVIYEVENEGLKAYFNRALWLPTDFTFIGENARGDHVRVHYFPGAQVPGPDGH